MAPKLTVIQGGGEGGPTPPCAPGRHKWDKPRKTITKEGKRFEFWDCTECGWPKMTIDGEEV